MRNVLVGLFGISLFVGLAFVFAPSTVMQYVDPLAFLIVGGGTVLVTVLRSGLAPFLQSLRIIARRRMDRLARSEQLAHVFGEMAILVRRDGPLALEHHQVDDEFLAQGLARYVDGADEARLQIYLNRELTRVDDHHLAQVDCWRGWIDHAPAMGLIGTLIGLVGVLGNVSDPQAIGPALGLALLTTLYGAVLANLVGVPVLARLQRRLSEDRDYYQQIADGLCVLARGGSSRQMREALQPHLTHTPVLKLVGNG